MHLDSLPHKRYFISDNVIVISELTRNTYKFIEVQLSTLFLSKLNEMPKVRLKSKLKWKV